MTDSLTPEKRSWNMSRIRGTDTAPEVKVRKYLFSEGFRFRKNDKRYPGKPDIVLPKYRTVIFINGCFWHRHEGCSRATTPKSNLGYWIPKFERNVANDAKHKKELEDLGWHVIVLWECTLKKGSFDSTMEQLIRELRQQISE